MTQNRGICFSHHFFWALHHGPTEWDGIIFSAQNQKPPKPLGSNIDDPVLGITARFDNNSQGFVTMVVYGQISVPRRFSTCLISGNFRLNSRALLLHVWDGNGLDCPG